MKFRLFYFQLEKTYDNLISPFKPWCVAEWQPNIQGGKWYELDRHYLPERAYAQLRAYEIANVE